MREHLIINELSEEFLLKEINRTPALPSQRFALLHTLHSAGNSFVHSVFHSHVILYEYWSVYRIRWHVQKHLLKYAQATKSHQRRVPSLPHHTAIHPRKSLCFLAKRRVSSWTRWPGHNWRLKRKTSDQGLQTSVINVITPGLKSQWRVECLIGAILVADEIWWNHYLAKASRVDIAGQLSRLEEAAHQLKTRPAAKHHWFWIYTFNL